MYAWIWHHLPGPTGVRVLLALLLLGAALALLLFVVFPWAITMVPGQDVSIDGT